MSPERQRVDVRVEFDESVALDRTGGSRKGVSTRPRGFTLVEVTIVIAVLALSAAVVIPALSNVTREELRANASKLCGTIRASYDQAALSGEPYRLAFEIGKPVIKVEQGTNGGPKGPGLMALASAFMGGGGAGAGEGASQEKAPPTQAPPPSEILSLFGLPPPEPEEGEEEKPSEAGATESLTRFQSTGHDLTLEGSVRLLDVWIEGMAQAATEGTAYLQFFPHGYTENALIHLTDEDGNVFTVKVAALTGKTEIVGEYVEVPK